MKKCFSAAIYFVSRNRVVIIENALQQFYDNNTAIRYRFKLLLFRY